MFGQLTGESLKRTPRGFDDSHPMAEWLKLKQFFVGVSMSSTSCATPSFIRVASDICERATPFVRFLNEAMGGSVDRRT